MDVHPRQRRALQRAARWRLPEHRVRAMHARDTPRRAVARRSLVVGARRRAQGMRSARRADSHRANRRDFAMSARFSPIAISGPTQLDLLESEAIHILREVAAECERPALLFSG